MEGIQYTIYIQLYKSWYLDIIIDILVPALILHPSVCLLYKALKTKYALVGAPDNVIQSVHFYISVTGRVKYSNQTNVLNLQ